MMQRVLFFGTPEFALPALQALLGTNGIEVLGVVTQPDKPSGRGQKLTPPAIKVFAAAQGLSVFQPVSLKNIRLDDGRLHSDGESEQPLLAFLESQERPDAFVTAAYGKILPQSIIDYPRGGVINVHASILPRWRGAAPIQRAIFAGDVETGVSLMRTEIGLDTGPVYCRQELNIEATDNAGTLEEKLAALGAKLLAGQLLKILGDKLRAVEQDDRFATHAAKWDKSDLLIRWDEAAEVTCRRIRASSPQSGARALFAGEPLKIYSARPYDGSFLPIQLPGAIAVRNKKELVVACGERSYVALEEMQFPGKKRLPIADILRGQAFAVGQQFTEVCAA